MSPLLGGSTLRRAGPAVLARGTPRLQANGRPPSEHGSPVGVGAVAIIEATADPDLLGAVTVFA